MALNVNGGGAVPLLSDLPGRQPGGADLNAGAQPGTLKSNGGVLKYGGAAANAPLPGEASGNALQAGSGQQGGGLLQGLMMLIGLQSLLQTLFQSAGSQQTGQTTQSGEASPELQNLTQTGVQGGSAGAGQVRSSEHDTSVRPTEENLTGRPPGDNRSAEQILDENPVLKNLGNQKDIKRDRLKERFGDWTESNPDPKSRADAAYNMACVLNSVKGLKDREGGDRGSVHTNGKLEGITKSGDARHGTEAGVLKDIAEKGLSALPADGNLPQTKDTHVRKDGTNKDNFQWGMGEVGRVLSNIPILKSVLAPMFNNIGEARTLGEVFTGGLTGLAEGAMSAARGPAGWAVTAATDVVSIAIENGGKNKKDPPPFS
uniref:hypothetical protein n=1 Tax=Pantoea sp. IMH TaxID=1267600 RepID=UPI000468E5FB|nr:hypothetical protein [Pantoea sp. IMH]